jgi:hypothetical protein
MEIMRYKRDSANTNPSLEKERKPEDIKPLGPSPKEAERKRKNA